ncbi:MAG: polyprenol monophosphomannose synthase [Acidimicrobiia bacterium]
MRVLVVLPTFNESATIVEVLRRVRSVVPDAALLVVDDSSPDSTADLAEAAGRELGGVEVHRRPHKAGLGSAYRQAFSRGLSEGYDVLVQMDSDLSHDPSVLPGLLEGVERGADVAVGSRYVPGGRIPDWSWHRRALSRWGNRYARFALGLTVRDATSGFRAYRREVFSGIDLERMASDGYGFQVEMAYRVERAGGRMVELPIEFRDRAEGCSKMSGRIIAEALLLVSWWGLRDLVRGSRLRGPEGRGGDADGEATPPLVLRRRGSGRPAAVPGRARRGA